MHVIIIVVGVLLVAFVLFLLIRQGKVSNPGDNAVAASPAQPVPGLDLAFISNGKLFYNDGGKAEQIHSPYIQELMDRMERSQERHAWKENTSFGVSMTGRMRQFTANNLNIVATSAQFDQGNSMLYFLKDEGMGGLFSYNFADKTENRLLHRQNLHLEDLNLDAHNGKILCSSHAKNGTSNIAMINRDGSQYRELTGGDTFDTAPTWVSGEHTEILYQSSGLARDQGGYVVAQGNASIQLLNLTAGSVMPIMDDPQYDFLHPRVCPKGNLYFIRRPYDPPKYGSGALVLDTLLFPFRLLRAVFHYLNFFSLMYSRKPLTSASGPALHADLKDIILKGKRINAEKALRTESMVNGIPSLVPKSWQLVRRTPQGDERVMATNVVSYDITLDGQIVYSNGRGVFLLDESGNSKLIVKADLVGDVIAQCPLMHTRLESERTPAAAGV